MKEQGGEARRSTPDMQRLDWFAAVFQVLMNWFAAVNSSLGFNASGQETLLLGGCSSCQCQMKSEFESLDFFLRAGPLFSKDLKLIALSIFLIHSSNIM